MTGIIVLGIITAVCVALFITRQKKSVEPGGKISGIVLEKKSGKGAKGVYVSLGDIEVKGGSNNFIPEPCQRITTKEDGKFIFENLKPKIYWVMAERNGRKVLKPVKLTKEEIKIEDVGIII